MADGKKTRKLLPENYIYASARLRAVGNSIPDTERVRRMAQAKNTQELCRMLEEDGISVRGQEAELDPVLSQAFALVVSVVPDAPLFDIFRFPYDCHNIKSALKAKIRYDSYRYTEEARHLMLSCGTVETEKIIAAVRDGNESVFPPHMAQAAKEAEEAYAKSQDPQLIDILLDRACYSDMEERAAEYGNSYFSGLVSIREDTTNLLTAIRLLRMQQSSFSRRTAAEQFRAVCVPFGTLDMEFFAPALGKKGAEGEEALIRKLALTRYSPLSKELAAENLTLTQAEKLCEMYYLDFVRSAKGVLYGPEVVAQYLVARETEVKNLRVILSGKKAELSPETIKERLRG